MVIQPDVSLVYIACSLGQQIGERPHSAFVHLTSPHTSLQNTWMQEWMNTYLAPVFLFLSKIFGLNVV